MDHQPTLVRSSRALHLIFTVGLQAESISCRTTIFRPSRCPQARRSSSSPYPAATSANRQSSAGRILEYARFSAGENTNAGRQPPYSSLTFADRAYDPFTSPNRDHGRVSRASDRQPSQRFDSRESYTSRKPLARSQRAQGQTVFYRLDKQEFPHLILNEDITTNYIQEQTVEGLRPPVLLSKRLSDIDRSKFMIQELSKSQNPDIAICKLVHKPMFRQMTERLREEEKKEFEGMTIDEDIWASFARVKENDTISEPVPMARLLKDTNREKFVIKQLSKADASDTVIVKLIDKEEYRRDARERRKERKKGLEKTFSKQIELHWTITQNDLNHKFRQLEGFIGKRKKVEIMIAPKPKTRKATKEEAALLVKNIQDHLAKINARETKAEGTLAGLMTLNVQPKQA